MPKFIQYFIVGFFLSSTLATSALAHNKVVVIPMSAEAVSTAHLISLPVETAVIHNDATYILNGGGDLSGMAFPDSGFPRFSTGFSLPLTYVAGTDIAVRIIWGNSRFNATSCGVVLRSNGVSTFRPNFGAIYTNGTFNGSTYFDGSRITLTMPGTSEQIREVIMIIAGKTSLGDSRYEPGDNLIMTIARQTSDTADTCTGKLFILAMSATF